MSETIDARGLSCPQPVLMVMEEMNKIKKGEFSILVDTETAKENVSKTANSRGWNIKRVEILDQDLQIVLNKD